MKKIKSRMAAVAQLAMTGNLTGKKKTSADEGQKINGIFKGIKKVLMPNSKSKGHQPEPAETTREATVEDLEEQIKKNCLLDASKNLIDLEHKILKDPLLQDKTEELQSLYNQLESAVFQVIKDSITETNAELLSQAVNAIVEQEKEDARYVSDNVSTDGSRPKRWKQRWEDYVRFSVNERIGKFQVSSKDSPSSLSQNFLHVGKTFKKDLVHVVTHLKDHYPQDFDVCNKYALHYHRFLVSQMDLVVDNFLENEDIYFILCWVHNYYPNMVLKDPTLIGHIEPKFTNLLAPDMVKQYETTYVNDEMSSIVKYMKKSLDMEVERWKNGKEPEILGNCHHSELHIDIIQIYNGAVKKARKINEDIMDELSFMLSFEIKYFFRSYQSSLEEFLEKNKAHPYYREIGIANLNCCFYFRDFIKHKDTKFDLEMQGEMLSTILQCEDLTYDALFKDFFVELKEQFRKMSQGSSLCSYQTMQDIIRKSESTVSGLQTLCPPCYTDMIGRIHKHLVKEYLTRLLKRKVSRKNVLQLQTLADQIHENAKLITDFCDAHKSQEDWIKPVIPKVAEIIRLQDLSAIQLEVATLVEEYPDIRNKQIEAILYIKGNLSRHDIKSILKVSETVERKTSKPKLFELLKPS